MRELNTNSLKMVKQELTEQCATLAASCQVYRQDTGPEALQTLTYTQSALRGACEMLEIDGAVLLLRELEALFGENTEKLVENTNFADDLSGIVQILTNYLGFVHKLGNDQPLLLLPEINQVRELAGKPPLAEADFLVDCLPEANIIEFVNEKSAEILTILRRARHLFQQGLIHAIRGTGHSGAFRIMSHAVRRVHETLGDETEKRYWLLVFQVMESFAKGRLSADKPRLRSLMAVERQLRQLVQRNTQLAFCYPETLQRTMMGYLALADLQTKPAERLYQQLGVTPCRVNDQQIRADRALLGSEGEQSFADNMSLLRDKIDSIAALVQLFEDGELDQQMRTELLDAVLGVADLCGLSGLAKGAKMFGEYAQTLRDQQEQAPQQQTPQQQAPQQQAPQQQELDAVIGKIIDAILYLECLLLELEGRAPTAKQLDDINNKSCQEIIESNIAKHAEVKVIDEAITRLRDVMARITDMQDGTSGFSLSDDNFHEVFDTLSGATRMLNLQKAAAIAKQCGQYARSGKLLIDLQKPESMSTFADVLVSLEYYLDNCRWDHNFDVSVLDIAEECLEQLR